MIAFKPFKPGIWIMRRIRLPIKLGVLALVLIIPLLVTTFQLVLRLNDDIVFSDGEQRGIVIVRDVELAAQAVQRHRGLTAMLKGGNTQVTDKLAQERTALAQLASKVDADIASNPDFELAAKWKPLHDQVLNIESLSALAGPESFAKHSALVDQLHHLMYSVADSSGLLFDPEPGTYFLMDMIVSHAPAFVEIMGQTRGMGAGQIAAGGSDAQGLVTAKRLLTEARGMVNEIAFRQSFLGKYIGSDNSRAEALSSVNTFMDLATKGLNDIGSVSAPEFFAAGTKAIDAMQAYQGHSTEKLIGMLDERMRGDVLQRNVAVGASVIGLLLVGYLILSFFFSFVIDFRHLIEVMRETSSGNLRANVKVRGSDELSELSSLVETMTRNLSGMVAEVRSNSALVAFAGKSLADGNRELSDRTEQQAANLEQTAASVQELSSTVHQNAQTAGDSDSQAASVRDVAESGSRTMVEAVESVEDIQRHAQQMNDIISVIDSLAFQTNILALNAAVEAARAGEQGRGFAVVANEVRTLAQRSAASAKEIRQLIETSSRQVGTSVKHIRSAGESMQKIVNGVRGVASNMSLISAASAEQSSSLSEISSAVRQLDEITQRNASMVERAVNQSVQLEEQAGNLAKAVSSFRLQQGTADEAMVMVNAAIEARRDIGRDGFLSALTDPNGPFHDRDMYVFALDRSGQYLAFGGNPAKVGSRVQDIKGVDGQALLESIVAQAEIEPGWVQYDIVNPSSGAVQTKMSFVTKIDDVYVGCGIYKTMVAV